MLMAFAIIKLAKKNVQLEFLDEKIYRKYYKKQPRS
jgi:hypothetical protein